VIELAGYTKQENAYRTEHLLRVKWNILKKTQFTSTKTIETILQLYPEWCPIWNGRLRPVGMPRPG
jgi:hypothetical protein